MALVARIHSFESFGTLDGPGIRFVVFFQGCLMRCLYCHNRDTWDLHAGIEMTVEDLMKEVRSSFPYMRASGGGVTASGGEPTLQAEFIRDWFKLCLKEGINTCLDTNGFARKLQSAEMMDQLLDVTDLVMLDLKQMDNKIHHKLVGVTNTYTLEFAKHLQRRKQKTWIRHVVVPGWTDSEKSIRSLGQFTQDMDNIERIELLAYHELGKNKWEEMHVEYKLEGVKPPTQECMLGLKKILEEYGHQVIF